MPYLFGAVGIAVLFWVLWKIYLVLQESKKTMSAIGDALTALEANVVALNATGLAVISLLEGTTGEAPAQLSRIQAVVAALNTFQKTLDDEVLLKTTPPPAA